MDTAPSGEEGHALRRSAWHGLPAHVNIAPRAGQRRTMKRQPNTTAEGDAAKRSHRIAAWPISETVRP